MTTNIKIQIFGELTNPEAIWDLGNAAAAETTVDWMSGFEVADFSGLLEAAANEERALVLVRSDTKDLIDAVRSTCMDAGLSFVAHYAASGVEGYTNGIAWRPGMRSEYEFLVSGHEDVLLPLSAIRQKHAAGPGAIDAMLTDIIAKTTVGKIVVTPEFRAEYEEYSGYPWGSASISSPR